MYHHVRPFWPAITIKELLDELANPDTPINPDRSHSNDDTRKQIWVGAAERCGELANQGYLSGDRRRDWEVGRCQRGDLAAQSKEVHDEGRRWRLRRQHRPIDMYPGTTEKRGAGSQGRLNTALPSSGAQVLVNRHSERGEDCAATAGRRVRHGYRYHDIYRPILRFGEEVVRWRAESSILFSSKLILPEGEGPARRSRLWQGTSSGGPSRQP